MNADQPEALSQSSTFPTARDSHEMCSRGKAVAQSTLKAPSKRAESSP